MTFMPNIPMSSPDITDLEREAVLDVLAGGQLSLGPALSKFEHEFARYIGTKHAIGVSSGTSGLHICIIAAGCQPGDAVVTSPFSFVASANVILYERGIPLFVDVDEITGNIDPNHVVEAIESVNQDGIDSEFLPRSINDGQEKSTGRIGAFLPVHAFGQPADIEAPVEAARKAGVAVIEDACEAIGAFYKSRIVGGLGDAAVFAFYPNKQMTTGEGGIIVTNEDTWETLARSVRNQGRDVFDEWLNHSRLGYNYRIDELSAALGLVQLARIEELLQKREQVAHWYKERLQAVEGVVLPQIAATTTRLSWFVYVIRLASADVRKKVMLGLNQRSVPSRPYFSPIHLLKPYVERFGYKRGDFPVAERLGDVSLALPFSSVMTEGQVDYVCESLKETIQASS